jgi:hypothetical protein
MNIKDNQFCGEAFHKNQSVQAGYPQDHTNYVESIRRADRSRVGLNLAIAASIAMVLMLTATPVQAQSNPNPRMWHISVASANRDGAARGISEKSISPCGPKAKSCLPAAHHAF